MTEAEVRVLGCLLEKEAATPEYYPLSLNALTNACNQKSNRDPVVSYDEDTVAEAFDGLRHKGLATRISGQDMRVPKHGHLLAERFNLGRREQALLCVLLLRGAQTVGELRGRTERMYEFDDLEAVESCLNRLMEWEPDPLVTRLDRPAGFKEPRYAHLLSGPVESLPEPAARAPEPDRLTRLEQTVQALQQEVAELRAQVSDFRRQFE
ncbi:MAG TPA: YceH family protein [Bryobacteraceae bacterium]|nr:YceH family protein [Bryobacteraceae bacterium]